jgi:hypothetical protein
MDFYSEIPDSNLGREYCNSFRGLRQPLQVNTGLEAYLYIGLNGKFLPFSNEKSIIFLNIFTIFN